ncbi:MAG: TIGR01777 family oxidoreductase [Salibacteraceae bacterium]
MSKILLTGGTGLIGSRLASMLQSAGHEVTVVSRNPTKVHGYPAIGWDELSNGAMEGTEILIHLAGAGIADERWTPKRKEIIIKSRSETAAQLMAAAKAMKTPLKQVLAASAIGIYGMVTNDHWYTEEDQPHDGFVAQTTRIWEESTTKFREELKIPTAQIRIGVVLAKESGALPKIAGPVKFGAGAALGNGKQWIPWVHIEDICQVFMWALKEGKDGIYNGVAPLPVTNDEMNKVIAKVLGRPYFLPNAPAFVIRAVFGELAQLVLEGSRVSAEKVQQEGFQFQYPNLELALKEIYQK